jgi:hypothetical protein
LISIKTLLLVVAIGLGGCASAPRPASLSPRADAVTQDVLKQLRQELQTAIASGDRARLEQLLDESFVFVHSTGKLEIPDGVHRPNGDGRCITWSARDRLSG